jgi:CRP/FNR family cyclic AMP-dependent transcriptional regulator
MELSFLKAKKNDLTALVAAVRSNKGDDTLARFMPDAVWAGLSEFLSSEKVERGHVLMSQGALDRTLYFVESGTLRVHFSNPFGQIQLAVLGAGAVVGEGSFFSQIERNATVQATQPSALWALTPGRFEKLALKDPTTALAVSMALGAVLSTRMLDVSRKIAVT